MEQYFYITIHFFPQYIGVSFENIEDDIYECSDGGRYRKRRLYDCGWGQEDGFELLPPLNFSELISLTEQPNPLPPKKFWQKYSDEQKLQANVWRNNFFGAVSVIMQDHVSEFIEFLESKIGTDYFSAPHIRENFKFFAFDTQKTFEDGKFPSGVLTRSYEEVLNDYPQWRKIAPRIVETVYG